MYLYLFTSIYKNIYVTLFINKYIYMYMSIKKLRTDVGTHVFINSFKDFILTLDLVN